MMKAFTDELVFNPVGNEVTLVVYHKRNRDISELWKERLSRRKLGREQRTLNWEPS